MRRGWTGFCAQRAELEAQRGLAALDAAVGQARARAGLAARQRFEVRQLARAAYDDYASAPPGNAAAATAKLSGNPGPFGSRRARRGGDRQEPWTCARRSARLAHTRLARKQADAALVAAFDNYKERLRWGGLDAAAIARATGRGAQAGPAASMAATDRRGRRPGGVERLREDPQAGRRDRAARPVLAAGAVARAWQARNRAHDEELAANAAVNEAVAAQTAADSKVLEATITELAALKAAW